MLRSPGRAVVLAGLALLSGACGYDITTQGALAKGAVATYHAPGVSFGSYATFAIVDRVGLVTDAGPGKTYVSAPTVIDLVTSALQTRGFTKVAEIDPTNPPSTPAAADLSVNVTALDAAKDSAAYWKEYGGYWEPDAWGYPSASWSYPWEWVPVAPWTGTLLVEMGDLKNASGGQIEIVWAALGYAVSEGSGVYDTTLSLAAVNQAFAQSPYLRGAGATP